LKKLLALIAFSGLLLVPGGAQEAFGNTVPLSDLLAGQSIVFGDKEFKNFRNLSQQTTGLNVSPADPALINVTPVIIQGEVGLQFSSGGITQSTFFAGHASGQGTFFEFDVLVLDPNLRISDNSLILSAHSLLGGPTSAITINESVEDPLGLDLAEKDVFAFNSGGNNKIVDHKVFPPQSQVVVSTNVILTGDIVTGSSAELLSFQVTFSQERINIAVGGEMIPVDSTSLLVAGAQMNAVWMIPVIISTIGIGIVIARKF